ncbi:MAG: helix-turn-helix domain-containing protein [Eggerthellaceae bacterium]|nr:helix-turn-helix domain-containing protein [Eggerthellaceae bacterium]
METLFAVTLKRLRKERGLSQAQLGRLMFVNKSSVARWENGSRLPDAAMIVRLAKVLGVNVGMLLSASAASTESPNIILVDDNRPVLSDCLSVMEEVLPNATITGFTWPQEALDYAKENGVALAVLDIELGNESGFDLCRALIEANPHTNVVYLTAYPDYSLDAWDTEACGFMVKPLTPEAVRKQLGKLRYPLPAGGASK